MSSHWFSSGQFPNHASLSLTALTLVDDETKYICLVDDDNEPLNVQQQQQQQELAPFVVSLLKLYDASYVVGGCHGLLCLYGFHKGYNQGMVVIWNPSIGKSFGIDVPRYGPQVGIQTIYGFGVCPVTSDPTVVKVLRPVKAPWHAQVFTLSSGVWNVLPSKSLFHESIGVMSSQVVIDRFIYWVVHDMTFDEDGNFPLNCMAVSFDLITKEFKVVDLPDTLTNELSTCMNVCVSKLRGSLAVSGCIWAERGFGVWVMEHDSSFTKLFSIGPLLSNILWFRKNGETIFETQMEYELCRTLNVYDPRSQQIKNLGIAGLIGSFFMDSYKQSLLLLDHPELHIYPDDSTILSASPCLSAFAAGRAAASKMFKTINTTPEIDAYNTKGKVLIHDDTELKNVYFAYPTGPDEPIFSGFSFYVPSGTTAALVGQSGSGKSTVISA